MAGDRCCVYRITTQPTEVRPEAVLRLRGHHAGLPPVEGRHPAAEKGGGEGAKAEQGQQETISGEWRRQSTACLQPGPGGGKRVAAEGSRLKNGRQREGGGGNRMFGDEEIKPIIHDARKFARGGPRGRERSAFCGWLPAVFACPFHCYSSRVSWCTW